MEKDRVSTTKEKEEKKEKKRPPSTGGAAKNKKIIVIIRQLLPFQLTAGSASSALDPDTASEGGGSCGMGWKKTRERGREERPK